MAITIEALWAIFFVLEGFSFGQFTTLPWQPPAPVDLVPLIASLIILSVLLLIGAVYCWNGNLAGYRIGSTLSVALVIGFILLFLQGVIPPSYLYQAYFAIVWAASAALMSAFGWQRIISS